VLTMNSVKILHAVRLAITATAELLVHNNQIQTPVVQNMTSSAFPSELTSSL